MKCASVNAYDDVSRVVHAIRGLTGGVCASTDPAWSRPVAIRVIDCVLSLNRHYDRFVVPRLEALMRVRPDLQTVAHLRGYCGAILRQMPSFKTS